jgi:hypothetical protein
MGVSTNDIGCEIWEISRWCVKCKYQGKLKMSYRVARFPNRWGLTTPFIFK